MTLESRPRPRPLAAALLGTLCVLGLFAATPGSAEPFEYTIDRAHSSISFGVRHFFNEVPGRFTDFDGTLVYDAADPSASKVEIVVQSESIDTDQERRDEHLRSDDFFAAEKYPTVHFRSTRVQQNSDGTLSVTGDLTLRGKTKRMTVPARVLGVMELGGGAAKAAFETELEIDRQEFGVSWNRALDNGGAVLGNTVTVRIILQADRKVAEEG